MCQPLESLLPIVQSLDHLASSQGDPETLETNKTFSAHHGWSSEQLSLLWLAPANVYNLQKKVPGRNTTSKKHTTVTTASILDVDFRHSSESNYAQKGGK